MASCLQVAVGTRWALGPGGEVVRTALISSLGHNWAQIYEEYFALYLFLLIFLCFALILCPFSFSRMENGLHSGLCGGRWLADGDGFYFNVFQWAVVAVGCGFNDFFHHVKSLCDTPKHGVLPI